MGVMIRFSAETSEIERMLRYLGRRMPGGMLMLPLVGADRHDLRFRRTPRPLLERLNEEDGATAWGLRPGAYQDWPVVTRHNGSERLVVDADASHLILLQLDSAEGFDRRRNGLLSVRDWWNLDPTNAETEKQALFARSLVERCARRVRRRGYFENGRWHIEAH